MSLFQILALVIYGILAFTSILALSIGFFKVFQFRRMGVGKRDQADQILDHWLSGRPAEAMKGASERKFVLARVLQAVFSGLKAQPNNTAYAEELGKQTAIIELASLGERMRGLEMVVQAAPMLGLLGTVIGMIDAFGAIALSEGTVDPSLLASGIYTALATTAVGLAVALMAFFIATWLEGKIERERHMMEALISAAIHGRVTPTSPS